MEKDGFFIDATNGFLAYKTTAEDLRDMRTEFEEDFEKSNVLNSKTVYDREESRMAGILGEIAFGKWAGKNGLRKKGLLYDYIYMGKKIDVKCKFRTVKPRPDFEASFFAYQGSPHFKEVDNYAFLSTTKGFDVVWFCGWTSKESWLNNPHGVLWKAGMTDFTNGKTFHKDTYSVLYKYLNQF